ncbi:MAG: inositol monophosphatase family protein [Verrucomicrobiia bacterium]
MKDVPLDKALAGAVKAARAAGRLMRANRHLPKRVKTVDAHDIKLELDVRSQKLIEKILRTVFPQIPLLGEEGDSGDVTAEHRWVVDPIDGTVNYAYGIPHACVSIALQQKAAHAKRADYDDGYATVIGVVYDPFCNELWTAVRGRPARLNGRVIHASRRRKLGEAVVSIGFAKSRASLETALPYFAWLSRRVRKIRMMGAAALALTYVATGRFDAYLERSIHLWDIAAGGLIVECAGGKFWFERIAPGKKFRLKASNGLIHRKLPAPQ